MRDRPHGHPFIVAGLLVFIAGIGILVFFENAYFAAPFFGVPVPSWAAWVAVLPPWMLNVVDTAETGAVIALVILSVEGGETGPSEYQQLRAAVRERHRRRGRRLRRASRGSVAGWAIGLFLLVLVLAILGFTVPSIAALLHKFVFGSTLLGPPLALEVGV
ncbi:MAG TPA: hypothetical protein VFF67_10285 [Thermoplasmata archaeon]|nr:hypothetical protein [Thermoplasmata archaeon]